MKFVCWLFDACQWVYLKLPMGCSITHSTVHASGANLAKLEFTWVVINCCKDANLCHGGPLRYCTSVVIQDFENRVCLHGQRLLEHVSLKWCHWHTNMAWEVLYAAAYICCLT
jgi:hypothetical protein